MSVKLLKSLLMGTGGVVLAGFMLALLAPKAVHAVVATAVQVVNTSANPAITEDNSRQAAQIVTIMCPTNRNSSPSCTQVLPNGDAGALPGPHGGYVVPANQSFVIKSLDSFLNTSVEVDLVISTFGTPGARIAESVVIPANGQISFSSGIVAGPGTEVSPDNGSLDPGVLTLHGYLTSN
jgi:hypothetical protein